jgi:hypothetical protein
MRAFWNNDRRYKQDQDDHPDPPINEELQTKFQAMNCVHWLLASMLPGAIAQRPAEVHPGKLPQ